MEHKNLLNSDIQTNLPNKVTTILRKTICSYFVAVVLVGLMGCQKNQDPEPTLNIPKEVQPFVDTFVAEAKKRGIDIKIDNLIVEFGNADGDFVCGRCKSLTIRQKYIVISTDFLCWKEAYEQAKESLVFHELGHCYLARMHKITKFASGDYASLMNPDDVETYSICQYPINGGLNCDKRSRRQYYIDELFNENTPTPAWGK